MKKEEIFEILYGKEKWEVYREFQKIEDSISTSDYLYQYFDEIKEMLLDKKAYIRVRAFRLICKLAKYDSENKINDMIELFLKELDDDLPTAVRQCLKATNDLILYKPELSIIIKDKLRKLDYFKYNENMMPLIKKDIDNILKKY